MGSANDGNAKASPFELDFVGIRQKRKDANYSKMSNCWERDLLAKSEAVWVLRWQRISPCLPP